MPKRTISKLPPPDIMISIPERNIGRRLEYGKIIVSHRSVGSRETEVRFIGGLAVLLITALMGLRMGAVFTGDMSIPGTKSEQAATVIGEKFHTSGAAENGTVQIIFKAPDGQTLETESMRQIVKQTLDAISKDESIASVASPYNAGTISQTKEIGYANVTYRSQAEDVTEASKEMVLSSVEQARAHGVQTEIGGSVSFESLEIGGVPKSLA